MSRLQTATWSWNGLQLCWWVFSMNNRLRGKYRSSKHFWQHVSVDFHFMVESVITPCFCPGFVPLLCLNKDSPFWMGICSPLNGLLKMNTVARNKATNWCRRPLGGQSLTLGLCPKWRPNRKGLSFGEESWWKDPLFPGTAKLFDQSFPFGEKGSEKDQKRWASGEKEKGALLRQWPWSRDDLILIEILDRSSQVDASDATFLWWWWS